MKLNLKELNLIRSMAILNYVNRNPNVTLASEKEPLTDGESCVLGYVEAVLTMLTSKGVVSDVSVQMNDLDFSPVDDE